MDELREAIARALYEHEVGDDRAIALPWPRAHQTPWLRCADAALAAIEASGTHVLAPLEPTEAMDDAGGEALIDYAQGRRDFAEGTAPPPVTSASYDLGRRRASEEAEAKGDLMARLAADAAESDRRVRELLRDRPDLLAEYERRQPGPGAPAADG